MDSLFLYFNELSLFLREIEPQAQEGQERAINWRQVFIDFEATLGEVFAIRGDCKIVFPEGYWDSDFNGEPLSLCFKRYLPKDCYRRLLSKIKRGDLAQNLREVSFQGHNGVGLALADIAAESWNCGWAVSLPIPQSPWEESIVNAVRLVMDDGGALVGPTNCEIGHLSRDSHVADWRQDLMDWGAAVAASSELDVLEGHPIVMYSSPLEHPPPHVHLLESRNCHTTLAKFRVDVFERVKGCPTWDAKMQRWVECHREGLLRSWDRCQRGLHPFALVNQQ